MDNANNDANSSNNGTSIQPNNDANNISNEFIKNETKTEKSSSENGNGKTKSLNGEILVESKPEVITTTVNIGSIEKAGVDDHVKVTKVKETVTKEENKVTVDHLVEETIPESINIVPLEKAEEQQVIKSNKFKIFKKFYSRLSMFYQNGWLKMPMRHLYLMKA